MDIFRLPTVDQLKVKLGINNPGKGNIHSGYASIGLHVDDYEAQHAMTNEHGEVQFNTGVEMPDMVYRGQVREFAACYPGLGRLRHLEDKLLAVCRNLAFEDAVRRHPYVLYCSKQAFLGNPLHIDYQGLAQHYGFHTDMLDVTSNFDVATFFACCEWDAEESRYVPVALRDQPGVIYGVIPALFSAGIALKTWGCDFRFVGWQPLPRPAQQRAGAFVMQPGRCFASLPGVQRAYFKHDLAAAEKVWDAFGGGDVLFPDDEAANLSRSAQNLGETTFSILERAWDVLERWEGRRIGKKHRKNALKASGLKITKQPPLGWDGYHLPSSTEKLNARLNSELNNVRWRWATHGPQSEPGGKGGSGA